MLSSAHITDDGHIVDVSNREEAHPIYKTPSIAARFAVPLTREQSHAAGAVAPEHVQFSVRSFAAQLGLSMGHPACTQIKIFSKTAEVETMVTDVAGMHPLLETLKTIGTDERARLLRLFITPPESKATAEEVQNSMAQGACEFPQSSVQKDGTVRVPLFRDFHYAVENGTIDPADIRRALTGGGRSLLHERRKEKEGLPLAVQSGAFFLGAVRVNVGPFATILESMCHRDGAQTALAQTPSHFDPFRSQGFRQVELHNTNGAPERLPVEICCHLHKTQKPS